MEVTNFSRNLKALREQHGISQTAFAERVGITQTTVSNWETGGKMPRNNDVVNRICELFNVTRQDLYGFNDGLYAKRHGLQDAIRGAFAPEAYTTTAPLLGRVHAGSETEPEVLDDCIPVPEAVIRNHPRGYYLEVEGDCMSRVYPEGCFVLVDPDQEPGNGSIAVVRMETGDCVMRRLLRGANTMVLSPDSWAGDWEDIVISDGERTVELIGTVVWFQAARELA